MDFDVRRNERHQEREHGLGDRSFKFAGHTMRYRANAPSHVTETVAQLTENTDGSAVFRVLKEAILGLIEPDDRHLFLEAYASDTDPVTFEDLLELSNWLIEKQTPLPPTQPDSSPGSLSTNGTASTEISSTAPVAA